ncbi:flagellar protein FlgJ [Methylobacterium sp. BE186]|uniref:glycoside hydrolase family 73 protein n=1 Tax=Methylobacterium sp. BE186 TaxID=2817715 RepID=UPI0028572540|nr:glucosaminidase domain-containing protein [Methylobacterium sp. BE186]MDR7037403.1 flagellar protein FlgJ [Methylobacterium sp. BE186]
MTVSLVPRTNLGGYLAELGQSIADERNLQEARQIWGNQLDGLVGATPAPTLSTIGQAYASQTGAPQTPAVPTFVGLSGANPSSSKKLAGSNADFVSAMMPHAIEASKATGIDPRIIIAQSAIETGWGKSAPGNNYFGIKSHGAPGGNTMATTEVVNGSPVRISDSFRAFPSMAASAAGYADFINKNPRYGSLKGAQGLEGQAQALQASGYATDPQYGAKVLAVAKGLPAPSADMPMPGAQAAGFQIPQGQSDAPGSVVSPAIASGAQGLSGAAPTQAQPRISAQQAQQLRAMLGNPVTAPQAQAIIQRLTAPQEYGFQVVDGQLIRTSKSGTAEPIGLPKAPNLQTVKDDQGRTLSFNPQTGETRLVAPGADNAVRNLLTPEERAAAGVPASYRGPAQLDRDGKLLFPGSGQMGITPQEKTDAAGSTVLTERFKAIGEQGAQGQADLPLLGELRALGDQINTGALAAVQARLGEYGIKTEGSGKVEAYNALLDRLTPQQRIPGAGATSDFDARMFKGSLPRLINTPEGNKLIIDTLEAVAKDRQARGEIADAALLGPNQEGGITQQEALKRLKALPSVQTGFASGMRQLQQAGRLGKAEPTTDTRREAPTNGLSVGASTVIDGVTIKRVR